ncbi:MAG: metallophosphoesterase family protein [Anaerolineales bacterium]
MSKLSRRDFIRLSTIGLGGSMLAACVSEALAAPVSTDTSALTPTAAAVPIQTRREQKNNGQNGKGPRGETAPTSRNPNFIATEILGRPTNTSVTANIVPAAAMTLYYEYGTSSGTYTSQTQSQNASAGVPLETLISRLQPNTRYYYRLNYNNSTEAEHSFVTQRTPGSSFIFDIQGDSHPERLHKEFDPALYPITLSHAAADQPDFYMTIGDDFSVDQLQTVNADTVKALYINQRQWLGQVGAPVFLANGNHEQASMANLDGTADNVAVWAQTARNTLYSQPAPDNFYLGDSTPVQFIGQLRDYYAFAWGDALFVVLDQYWHSPVTVDNQFGSNHDPKGKRDLWQVTISDAQYQWLKQMLESSTAKYKFVFSHHVLGTQRGGIEVATKYEWGDAADLSAHRSGWDKTIHQLMVDNHVNIYFQGHDHIFVYQELDGVIYQTLPQPADPNYALNNADSYQSGDKLSNTGYVRVNVSPANVKVEYVRTYLPQDEVNGHKTGEVAYSYTV